MPQRLLRPSILRIGTLIPRFPVMVIKSLSRGMTSKVAAAKNLTIFWRQLDGAVIWTRLDWRILRSGIAFQIGEVSFEGQGRSRVMNVNKGLLHIYGEENTGRLLGVELIGPAAEHLTHLIAWSIQSGQTVSDVLLNPFYHPVIEEGLRSALRDLNSKLGFGPNPPLHCIDCGGG